MKNFLVLLFVLLAISSMTSCTPESIHDEQEKQLSDPPPSQEETEEIDPNS